MSYVLLLSAESVDKDLAKREPDYIGAKTIEEAKGLLRTKGFPETIYFRLRLLGEEIALDYLHILSDIHLRGSADLRHMKKLTMVGGSEREKQVAKNTWDAFAVEHGVVSIDYVENF